jgi:hypothetical protein
MPATATLGRTFRKARAAMNGEGKLEAAIAELKSLIQSYHAIEECYRSAACLLSSYEERANKAADAYREALLARDIAGIKAALEVWLPLRPLLDFARIEAGNLSAMRTAGAAVGIFTHEHPGAKATLLKVCELKLSAAKRDAERVTTDETKRLGSEWEPSDVAASPVVRRAKSKVNHLETQKRRIESESIQSVWNLAETLLE